MAHAAAGLIRPLIVWLSGNSGAGKTFTGDALARMAGFAHIDGDDLYWSTDPAEKALFGGLVKAFDFWFEGEPAPPELWHPYYARQCSRVNAAVAAGHMRVVISLTVYHRETRDYIRALLPEHVFVLLRCSRDELVRRARVRFAAYAASRGQDVPTAFAEAHKTAYTDATFVEKTVAIMRGLQPLAPDEVQCVEVDVTDGAPWTALWAMLGLGEPPSAVPADEIAEVNYQRFRDNAGK